MKAKVMIPKGWRKLRRGETMNPTTDRMLWGSLAIWDTLHPNYRGDLVGDRTVIRKRARRVVGKGGK